MVDFNTTELHDLSCAATYLGLLALAGYTTICLVLKPGRRGWPELLGFSFACGGGLIPLILFSASLMGAAPSHRTLVFIAIVAIAGLIFAKTRKGLVLPAVLPLQFELNPTVVLGGLALALILLSMFGVSTRSGWPALENIDAFAIWLLKAKWVALKPLLPVPLEFLDPTISYSHQDYPLAFPFLVAGFWATLGRIDDALVKILLVPTYLALICVMYSAVRTWHRRAIALAITAIFVTAPILTQNAGWAVPETFLILAYTCALSLVVRWTQTRQRGDIILAAIFMAVIAFTKNEGLALIPVIGVTTFLWAISNRNRQVMLDWLFAATICLVLIAPWLIYRTHLPRTHEDYGSKLTNPVAILHNLPRLGYVLPIFFSSMFKAGEAGPAAYVLVLIAIPGYKGFCRGPVLILWSILLIQFCLYIGAFMVTPWDIHVLVPMVTSRLLTQASPIAPLLIALHLRELPWAAKKAL